MYLITTHLKAFGTITSTQGVLKTLLTLKKVFIDKRLKMNQQLNKFYNIVELSQYQSSLRETAATEKYNNVVSIFKTAWSNNSDWMVDT